MAFDIRRASKEELDAINQRAREFRMQNLNAESGPAQIGQENLNVAMSNYNPESFQLTFEVISKQPEQPYGPF